MLRFKRNRLSKEILLELYEAMLKPRRIEEKMLLLLRQGKVTKWFSGIGQEAIAVGVTKALDEDEYILPMHRVHQYGFPVMAWKNTIEKN